MKGQKKERDVAAAQEVAATRRAPKRGGRKVPEPALADCRPHFQRGGVLELVGRTEAAAILGVAPPNLTPNRGMAGLPEPVVDYLAAGKLWLRRDIVAYSEQRQAELQERLQTRSDNDVEPTKAMRTGRARGPVRQARGRR